ANAILVEIVIIAREVLAEGVVGGSHVLATEVRGGGEEEIWFCGAGDERGESAGRSFLVERAERIKDQEALREIGGDVRFQRIDLRRTRENRELRHEAGARAHPSREEFDVGKIGRHADGDVGGIEKRDPGAEDVEWKRGESFDAHGIGWRSKNGREVPRSRCSLGMTILIGSSVSMDMVNLEVGG